MIDPNNAVHFSLEFLKSRIYSGITPYELKFKNVVWIMLTRNLNSSREPRSEMMMMIMMMMMMMMMMIMIIIIIIIIIIILSNSKTLSCPSNF